MKSIEEREKSKFEIDLETLQNYGVVINTYDNPYQIVIASCGYVFDYYPSTEIYSSRCSFNKMTGRCIGYLLLTLERIKEVKKPLMNKHSAIDPLSLGNVDMIPLVINEKIKPKGIIEKLAFWIIGKRGYKVIKQKENKDE